MMFYEEAFSPSTRNTKVSKSRAGGTRNGLVGTLAAKPVVRFATSRDVALWRIPGIGV